MGKILENRILAVAKAKALDSFLTQGFEKVNIDLLRYQAPGP